MNFIEGASLVAAAMTTGLMAGVFVLYAHTIMPGLGRTDDRTFVGAFQAIDAAIINPLFVPTFFGALVLAGLAAVLHTVDWGPAAPWTVAAAALYLTVIGITVRVHLPRNDEIKSAGEPDLISDLGGVRASFGEAVWVRWNMIRAVVCTAAVGCLVWALVEYGRG